MKTQKLKRKVQPKQKLFKIESKIRWLFWIPLILISLSTIACSAHRQNLIAWPKDFKKSNQSQICQARLVIQLETPEETVRADASLTFSLKGKDSEMKLILYTPILTPFAKIEVSKRLATWTDESGTRSLQKQPLFKKWFSNDWWKEIAFSLGTVTEETAPFIWMNESQQPVLYHKNKRRMECEFESFETQPQVCKISDEGLTGSLNFSSVECQSPL